MATFVLVPGAWPMASRPDDLADLLDGQVA